MKNLMLLILLLPLLSSFENANLANITKALSEGNADALGQALGVGVAAISSNDVEAYPEDSFANMKLEAARHGFTFPYLIDESQLIAKTYGAVCTPDFFGFDATGGLQYRGRLDASGRNAAPKDVRRELFQAMRQVAETGRGPRDQVPSMGCSIKWKAA